MNIPDFRGIETSLIQVSILSPHKNSVYNEWLCLLPERVLNVWCSSLGDCTIRGEISPLRTGSGGADVNKEVNWSLPVPGTTCPHDPKHTHAHTHARTHTNTLIFSVILCKDRMAKYRCKSSNWERPFKWEKYCKTRYTGIWGVMSKIYNEKRKWLSHSPPKEKKRKNRCSFLSSQ